MTVTHPNITAPDSEDDIERAEQELTNKRLNGQIKIDKVSPYLKTGGSNQIHTRFIQKVTEKVAAIRNNAKKSSIGDVSERLDRADTMSRLRQESLDKQLADQVSIQRRWLESPKS